MAEKYLFFNSTIDDRRKHKASDIAEYWDSFLSSGIVHVNGSPTLKVSANSTDMEVNIDLGKAVILGHLYINNSPLKKFISQSTASEDRLDRVILRLDLNIENRFIKVFIKEGTELAPPDLVREGNIYEISLAQIHVKAGKNFLEQSDIIDERLDEEVCGLASSLVTVPTDIFSEDFKQMLNTMKREWLDWFESVVGDSYVTVTNYSEDKRNIDRQLANVNSVLELDNRAIGNTGKFYDFFDNTNIHSVAKIDESFTKTIKGATSGQKHLSVADISKIKVGNEYVILGVENPNSQKAVTERISIASIEDNNCNLASNLQYSYVEGANIFRSNFKDGKFTKCITIDSWLKAKKQKTIITERITSEFIHPKFMTLNVMYEQSDFDSVGNNETLLYNSSKYASLTPIPIYDLCDYRYFLASGNSETNYNTYRVIDYKTNEKTSQQISVSKAKDNTTCFKGIFRKAGIYYLLVNGSQYAGSPPQVYEKITPQDDSFSKLLVEDYSDFFDFSVEEFGEYNYLQFISNDLFIFKGKTGGAKEYNLVKLDKQTDKYSIVSTITTNENIETLTDIFGDGKLLQINTSNNFLRYVDETYLETILEDITPGQVWGSDDGRTVFNSNIMYNYNGNNLTIVRDFSSLTSDYNHSNFLFGNKLYIFNKNKATIPYTYDVYVRDSLLMEVDTCTLHYEFEQPVANMAMWAKFAEVSPETSISLSSIDDDGFENYEELAYTVKDNEIEAYKANNIFEKPRNVLRLEFPFNSNIKRILGGIE